MTCNIKSIENLDFSVIIIMIVITPCAILMVFNLAFFQYSEHHGRTLGRDRILGPDQQWLQISETGQNKIALWKEAVHRGSPQHLFSSLK